MAFTMSYGATPPSARTDPAAPKVIAPKKPASHRVRKHSTAQAQAQALFDPTPAQAFDTPPSPAQTNGLQGSTSVLVSPEENAAAQSTHRDPGQ